jgi:carboxylesterase type B
LDNELTILQGSILGLPLGGKKSGIAEAFTASISESLPEAIASRLLSSYGIAPSTEDDEAFEKVLQFGGDMSFYAPTLAFAQSLENVMPVYMYRFNEENDWPGPWQGRSTHIHDLTYLLQNFNDHLDDEQTRLAEEWAADVIAFANGQAPWQRWTKGQKTAKVFEVGGTGEVKDVPEKTGRKSIALDLADEVGFDALKGALVRFMFS